MSVGRVNELAVPPYDTSSFVPIWYIYAEDSGNWLSLNPAAPMLDKLGKLAKLILLILFPLKAYEPIVDNTGKL